MNAAESNAGVINLLDTNPDCLADMLSDYGRIFLQEACVANRVLPKVLVVDEEDARFEAGPESTRIITCFDNVQPTSELTVVDTPFHRIRGHTIRRNIKSLNPEVDPDYRLHLFSPLFSPIVREIDEAFFRAAELAVGKEVEETTTGEVSGNTHILDTINLRSMAGSLRTLLPPASMVMNENTYEEFRPLTGEECPTNHSGARITVSNKTDIIQDSVFWYFSESQLLGRFQCLQDIKVMLEIQGNTMCATSYTDCRIALITPHTVARRRIELA